MSEQQSTDDAGATVINLDGLLERIHGNMEAMHQLIGMMLSHLPERLQAITVAIERADVEALSAAAHSLRGSLSNFTVGPSWTLAGDMETAARKGDLAGAMTQEHPLRSEVHTVERELRRWLKENDT